jgi:predicted PurR-regulated permease PerM
MREWWHESEWTNRRIFFLLAVGTFIVSAIWHLPNEFGFLSAHMGEIVFALVISMGFTYMLRPVVNAFEKVIEASTRRQSRAAATTLVFIFAIALVYIFVSIGLKPIVQDGQGFWRSFAAQNPTQRTAMVEGWKNSVDQALSPYRDLLPPEMTRDAENAIPSFILSAKEAISSRWLGWFSHIGFLVELILIPVLVFYFLADGPSLRSELKVMCPPQWRRRGAEILNHLDRVLDGYIRGQVLMCLIAWFLVTIGLLLLGVPHAFTLGMLAGLTRAVPIIGPLLGAVPIALVCLLTTQSIQITGFVLLGFTAMHFLESKVLLPKVIGHEVDLHPVSVILALLLGMEFFGFIGVFLAVPVAALGKVLLLEWQQSQLENAATQSIIKKDITADNNASCNT